MALRAYFAIVGKGDLPLFESSLGSAALSSSASPTTTAGAQQASKVQQKDEWIQSILNASLDVVDQKMHSTQSMQLRVVDSFQEWNVSSFVTASNNRFLLLHEHKLDDASVRGFFNECYEVFVKATMNPFYEPNTPLLNYPAIETKVLTIAKKYNIR